MVDRTYTETYWGTTQDYAKFKDSYFPENESQPQHERSRWVARLLQQIGFQSVLEVGSNFGRNLYHIKKSAPSAKVAGIDINKEALDFCKSKVTGDFVHGSLYDLDTYFKEPFDIVFSLAVLGHIVPKDLESVLEKMLKLAKNAVVHLEQQGTGNLVSGLPQDHPEWRQCGQYLWHHDYLKFYKDRRLPYEITEAPPLIQDIGFKHVIICKLP